MASLSRGYPDPADVSSSSSSSAASAASSSSPSPNTHAGAPSAPPANDVAALQAQCEALQKRALRAEARALYAESERDGLIDTLETAFGQICTFKRENGMSDDDDITGRWFKQLLATLRENEGVAAQTMAGTGGGIGHSPMPSTMPDHEMLGDALADVDMLGASFYSGTALSASVADDAYVFASDNAFDPLPLRSGGGGGSGGYGDSRRGRSGNGRRTTDKPKRKARQKSAGAKTYRCAICAKDFAGASGLWYHNKHVHGAITQQRPRKPKNDGAASAAAASAAASAAAAVH